MFLRLPIWCPLLGLPLLALSPISAAQEILEEIVVTADFRERTASDVPASVAVIDEARIREGTLQHFEELIASVPNLNWSGDGNRARYLQIRGVGELEQYEGAPNPSVGFLIDDIDFSGIATIATLFDMQQIEVLRGPQGTRYGANALAGLVYARSADPTEMPSARIRASLGGDDLIAGGVAISGPFTENGDLRYRLSVHHHESNGFRDNTYLDREDTNGRSETTARMKLDWEAANGWSFRMAGIYADIDDGYDAFALDNGLTMLSDRPGRDAQRSYGVSVRASKDIVADISLTSITSFARSDVDFSFDADWGNPDSWAPFVYDYTSETGRARRTFSQELRLASTAADGRQWLLGIYGMGFDEDLSTLNQGVYEDLVVFNFTDALDDRLDSGFEALNLAAFGQMTFPVIERGELTVGLRIERRTTDYADSAGLTLGPGETMAGGEISYSHALAGNSNAYLSVSRGYKAGGFNLGLVPEGRRAFGAEALWNAEAGLKTTWADGRLLANAAVFHNRREDQQLRTSVQLNPNDPASFVFYTDNAARGETLGFEGELRWLPYDGVETYLSVGLLDARIDEYVGADDTLSGRAQAHAPSYSAAAGGVFRHASGFFARLDVTATDAFFFDVSHDRRSESYELVNGRIGFESDRWSIQLWARNALDEDYAVRGFFFGNEPPDFPAALYVRRGDPRQVGMTFEMFFEE